MGINGGEEERKQGREGGNTLPVAALCTGRSRVLGTPHHDIPGIITYTHLHAVFSVYSYDNQSIFDDLPYLPEESAPS